MLPPAFEPDLSAKTSWPWPTRSVISNKSFVSESYTLSEWLVNSEDLLVADKTID